MPHAIDILEDGLLVGRTAFGDDVYTLSGRLFTIVEEWFDGMGHRWVVEEVSRDAVRR